MSTGLVVPVAPETLVQPAPTQIIIPEKIAQLPSVWTLEQSIEWLVEDIIPLGSITLLTGESGGGKTWVAYAIGGAVARGEAFAGHHVKQLPVLYLDGENPLCVVKQRLFDLGIPENPELRVWGGWVGDPPPGPDCADIVEYARQHQPLLIWDSLIDFHDGDEQSATETRAFMKLFRTLANAGATLLILHHTGKTETSQDYRGSSDIKGAVDTAYRLETEFSLAGGIHRLTLRNFKGRFAVGRDFALELVPKQGFIRCDVPQQATVLDAMQTVVKIVEAHAGSNQSQIVALAQAAGIGKHQVEKCLADGPFDRQRGNRNEWLYKVQIPNLPPPIEEGNREIEPSPAEVGT